LLVPHPTLKLENHPLSAVHDCLFNIFTSTLHSCRLPPPSTTCECAMTWRQGTHLILMHSYYISKMYCFAFITSDFKYLSYKPLTFQITIVTSFIHHISHSKDSVPRPLYAFLNIYFYSAELLSLHPTPKLETTLYPVFKNLYSVYSKLPSTSSSTT
jgi:hypothetical protein